MITLYSKPNCFACVGTKRFLKKHNLDFVEVDITQDDTLVDELKGRGFLEMPVVDTPNHGSWSGYQITLLEKLAKDTAS